MRGRVVWSWSGGCAQQRAEQISIAGNVLPPRRLRRASSPASRRWCSCVRNARPDNATRTASFQEALGITLRCISRCGRTTQRLVPRRRAAAGTETSAHRHGCCGEAFARRMQIWSAVRVHRAQEQCRQCWRIDVACSCLTMSRKCFHHSVRRCVECVTPCCGVLSMLTQFPPSWLVSRASRSTRKERLWAGVWTPATGVGAEGKISHEGTAAAGA